jgi:hypothetical protein
MPISHPEEQRILERSVKNGGRMTDADRAFMEGLYSTLKAESNQNKKASRLVPIAIAGLGLCCLGGSIVYYVSQNFSQYISQIVK